MSDRAPEVVVIGGAVVDIPLAPVGPAVFEAGSTPLERIAIQVGGDAANESLTLARLGHAPALVSKVGADAAGGVPGGGRGGMRNRRHRRMLLGAGLGAGRLGFL